MNSRERVLTALSCKQPDKVPYMYSLMHTELQEEILGYGLKEYRFDVDIDPGIIVRPGDNSSGYKLNYIIHPDTARYLQLDAIGIRFPSPIFAVTRIGKGGHGIERGLLTSFEQLKRIVMPDVDDEKMYRDAEKFIKEYREEFAVFASIRLGASSTLMSMGYDNFSYALYDDIELVYGVVDLYTNWMSRMVKNLSELGFDFMWAFDDIAFKSGPLFSVNTWKDVFFPRLKRVADNIRCPWIYHSDGNLLPILDEMIPLRMSGIHPLEPGAMDLDALKGKYGSGLCLVGNIDIDYTLSKGTIWEVEHEVEDRIRQLAPGGGYIISDSNSVPYFCKAENIVAMSRAVQKYGYCYQKGGLK